MASQAAANADRSSALAQLLQMVAARAQQAGVFGPVSIKGDRVECEAKASAAPAFFRVGLEDGSLWVSLVTADRWLSQSIEADLVHTGDKLEDLIAEELAEFDWKGPPLTFEHFRSEDKLFTFRSRIHVDTAKFGEQASAERATACLLAYEACFRELGDIDTAEE